MYAVQTERSRRRGGAHVLDIPGGRVRGDGVHVPRVVLLRLQDGPRERVRVRRLARRGRGAPLRRAAPVVPEAERRGREGCPAARLGLRGLRDLRLAQVCQGRPPVDLFEERPGGIQRVQHELHSPGHRHARGPLEPVGVRQVRGVRGVFAARRALRHVGRREPPGARRCHGLGTRLPRLLLPRGPRLLRRKAQGVPARRVPRPGRRLRRRTRGVRHARGQGGAVRRAPREGPRLAQRRGRCGDGLPTGGGRRYGVARAPR